MNVGVLLAAGASSRMGRPKALVRAGGESFLARGIRTLWSACDRVVVVLGSGAAAIRRATEDEFEALLAEGALSRDLEFSHGNEADRLEASFLVHRGWKRGMLSSARAGLREALRARPEAILLAPVDHPAVRPRTVQDLARVLLAALAACRTERDRARFSYALVPRHRGRRGHPVVLSPGLARAIVADEGAATLSDAIRRSARLVGYFEVRDPGVVRNRNAPGD